MFNIINTLSESRLFPSQRSLVNYDPEELAELAYLYILSLRILLSEDETQRWAENYCAKTTRGTGFRQWRSDGTDLYVLMHALTDTSEAIGGEDSDADYYRDHLAAYPSMVFRWIKNGSHSVQSENDTNRLFVRLDTMFKINNGSMRAIRRLVQDWPGLSKQDCRLAMTRLLQFMRSKAPRGELVPYLNSLKGLELHDVNNPEEENDDYVARDSGRVTHHEKNRSFLKTLAAVGAGAIAGAALVKSLSNKYHTKESASSGGTCAANVASVVGGIGAGFDDDYSKSVYPEPGKTSRLVAIIHRNDPTKSKNNVID